MRPFGSADAYGPGVVVSPADKSPLDPRLVGPGLVLGRQLEPLDRAPVARPQPDRSLVRRPR